MTPGPWREALSVPQVIGSLPDSALNLDLEIARERHPGQPQASNGITWSRGQATLDAQLKSGKITAEQHQSRSRGLSEEIRRRIQIQSVEAKDTLQGIEQALLGMPLGATVQSPGFQAAEPDLFESATRLGILSQASELGKDRIQAASFAALYAGLASGVVEKMTEPQLWSTFYARLGKTGYKEALVEWNKRQPGEAKNLPGALVRDELMQRLIEVGSEQRFRRRRKDYGL